MGQICVLQIGPTQAYLSKIGSAKIGALQVGMPQASVYQRSIGKLAACTKFFDRLQCRLVVRAA